MLFSQLWEFDFVMWKYAKRAYYAWLVYPWNNFNQNHLTMADVPNPKEAKKKNHWEIYIILWLSICKVRLLLLALELKTNRVNNTRRLGWILDSTLPCANTNIWLEVNWLLLKSMSDRGSTLTNILHYWWPMVVRGVIDHSYRVMGVN